MADESAPHAGELEALARRRFGDNLSQAEKRLLSAAPKGERAMCGPNFDDNDPANDPARADGWSREREIRAELIRWLCVHEEASQSIDPRGVRVYAAKITDKLDLSYATVQFPLRLSRCRLATGSDLNHVKIPALYLGGSSTGRLNVDGAEVRGGVSLSDGFVADGEVSLLDSRIGGQLDCSDATFQNPGGVALFADGANVGGGIFFDKVSTQGEVRLLGAQITGNLECDGGKFNNASGMALDLDSLKVSGYVFLRRGFSATGEVKLLNAEIGSNLECIGGKFNNASGMALNADRSKVLGSVFLREGFSAEGEVNLVSARIGSNLECQGSTFRNPGGKALSANQARVSGSVFLRDGFSAEGEVNLIGAQIEGSLECDGSTFKNPKGKALNADGSKVSGYVFLSDGFSAEGEVNFISAQVGRNLECIGGKFNNANGMALNADKSKVSGSVFLREGFSAEGEVNFVSAQVGSNLECEGGKFNNASGVALNLDHLKVSGYVFLREGFSATGEVNLLNAEIGSDLECIGGRFKNANGKALNADKSKVLGSVFLREGFSAEGEVNLVNAQIGSNLECDGSTFKSPGGKALNANQTRVSGSVFLRNGFSAEGEVNLVSAQIGSNLECEGSTFKNPKGKALNADAAKVSGSVFLREGFSAEGEVNFDYAQVAGDFECDGGKFDGLSLNNANVKGSLGWHDIKGATNQLDLRSASVGGIWDDKPSWPDKGNLLLAGLVYERIIGGPTDARTRLEWIDRQPDKYEPQPYRQLAKTLHDMGDDGGAKQVLFQMENRARAEDRSRIIHSPVRRLLRSAEDAASHVTVGYGIYPGTAIWYLCGLTALGWIVHRRAQRVGVMAPTDKDAYAEFHNGQAPSHYQPFNPLIYSLENCIPLVKLGQDERWQPDPLAQRCAPPVSRGKFGRVVDSVLDTLVPDWATTPATLLWFRWIMIGLGWLLATFFVAGLTGIIKAG